VRLISRSDVKAQRAVPEPKKRHVETVTRLPTKRMATACWAFIVAKWPELKTATVAYSTPFSADWRKFIHNLSTSRPTVRDLVVAQTRHLAHALAFLPQLLHELTTNRLNLCAILAEIQCNPARHPKRQGVRAQFKNV